MKLLDKLISMKRIYSGLLAILFFLPVLSYGQASKPLNWFHLDLKDDTVFGISMEKTYKELLKNKNPATVIVAVIDCGADTGHADLKTVLWRNVKETAGNGKDDDGNGYIDDVNGWNFLGWSKGDIIFENEEIVREIRRYSALFAGKDSNTIAKKRLSDYRRFKQLEAELAGKRKPMEQTRKNLLDFRNMANGIAAKIGKKNPTIEEFKNFIPSSEIEMGVLVAIVKAMKNNSNFESYIGIDLDKILEPLNQELDYKLNVDYDPRSGEAATEFAKKKGRYYGIPSPMSTDASHGTHVSGIIGADRTNGIGMMGVSGNVSIMNIRIVPDGDERDIDLANAIRYAVDNGAKIINMSFGKTSSPEKKLVDVAVKYALRKGVLFVHAAGNNAKNIDEEVVYPTRRFLNGKEVSAWIEVGASDAANNEFLPASFSNYGQRTVDVYAPGVEIYSLVLGNKYEVQSGTSMAAPVVSGLAATLWGYYPRLSANQLKEIIIKSVVKVPQLTDKCISGGVVNAYNAFILASTY